VEVTIKKEEGEDTELKLLLEKRSKPIEQQKYQSKMFKKSQQPKPSQLPQQPNQPNQSLQVQVELLAT